MKTKNRFWIMSIILGISTLFLVTNCTTDDDVTQDVTIPVLTTNEVSAITQTTATRGGTITSDDGATVTERGVCWSTSQNPTITENFTTDGTGAGSFTSNITNLTANTTYYMRAYATNSVGTGYGSAMSFTTLKSQEIDFNGALYVYPVDNSEGIQWYNGTYTVTGATSTTDGETNTAAIVANQGAGAYAAYICDTLTAFGYSDWYLPSINELNAMYLQKDVIGGFTTGSYWSSTEDNDNVAWYQNFYDGYQSYTNYGSKSSISRVRCVRR
jgi:hypothetical protein